MLAGLSSNGLPFLLDSSDIASAAGGATKMLGHSPRHGKQKAVLMQKVLFSECGFTWSLASE